MTDLDTVHPWAAERLLLGNTVVTLQALSAQGLGALMIYAAPDAVTPGVTPLGDSIAWPSADYDTIGSAWASVVGDPMFGGSTAVTTGTPLALSVDDAIADIAAMNAALDAAQGSIPGTSPPWLFILATVAAGLGVSYGLVRWRNR